MSVEISRTPIVRTGPPRPFGHSGLRDPVAVHDYAIRLMAAVEQEIGDLWRDTIDSGDPQLSDRLVDLSHAVRRAALAFENKPAIGRAALPRTGRLHLHEGPIAP